MIDAWWFPVLSHRGTYQVMQAKSMLSSCAGSAVCMKHLTREC